jgi:hypothetical protein
MTMSEWVYPKEGETFWLGDQAVLFYYNDGPFTQSGLPPMSDEDWERLDKSLSTS